MVVSTTQRSLKAAASKNSIMPPGQQCSRGDSTNRESSRPTSRLVEKSSWISVRLRKKGELPQLSFGERQKKVRRGNTVACLVSLRTPFIQPHNEPRESASPSARTV